MKNLQMKLYNNEIYLHVTLFIEKDSKHEQKILIPHYLLAKITFVNVTNRNTTHTVTTTTTTTRTIDEIKYMYCN